jgi:hypothetical protein
MQHDYGSQPGMSAYTHAAQNLTRGLQLLRFHKQQLGLTWN